MAPAMRHHQDEVDATAKDILAEEAPADPRIEARKQRIASLRRVAGIWADRTDIPADGLKYEREMRDEWR
jgi:hypothetical protein